MERLPVIFRAERTKSAEVTAVFPTLPFTEDGRTFTIYAHIGQHGAGGWTWYHHTRAARPEEYAELLDELRGIYGTSLWPGDEVYELVVRQRWTPELRREFEAEALRLRQVA